MGRAILDNVGPLSTADIEGWSLLRESLKAAVQDRANRGVRQVEEHYTAVRGRNLRRGRAAAANIVPATTGAAIAVTRAIPSLRGRI